MKLPDLQEMVRSRASDYQRMLAEKALARVDPEDGRALDALAGLMDHKGAGTIPEIVDMAGAVAPPGPIRSEHLQAAISHKYPSEALQILHVAMKHG